MSLADPAHLSISCYVGVVSDSTNLWPPKVSLCMVYLTDTLINLLFIFASVRVSLCLITHSCLFSLNIRRVKWFSRIFLQTRKISMQYALHLTISPSQCKNIELMLMVCKFQKIILEIFPFIHCKIVHIFNWLWKMRVLPHIVPHTCWVNCASR